MTAPQTSAASGLRSPRASRSLLRRCLARPARRLSRDVQPGHRRVARQRRNANTHDIDDAAQAAQAAAKAWRATKPLERAALLKRIGVILRDNAGELAMLDAANCGNPVSEMSSDARVAAAQLDFFAGLVTELKGETIPMGDGVVNMTVHEPYGVVARLVAYNHPLMFLAGKMGAPLAAGK